LSGISTCVLLSSFYLTNLLCGYHALPEQNQGK